MAVTPLSLVMVPLVLLLVLVLVPSRPVVAEADCSAPPPALLLASQVAELARTALSADTGRQHGGPAGLSDPPALPVDSQSTPDRPAAAAGSQDDLLARVQQLEQTVERLSAVAGRDGGPGEPGTGDAGRPATCLQLQRQNGSLPDGVYQLSALSTPVYCDFSHDGGGWTLLLTAATRDGWDRLNVRLRSADQPSLTDNYSILGRGDLLKTFGRGARFAYRLEGQAQVNRRQWGGIWLAPRDYTFTPETDTQRDIALVVKFNSWTYKKTSLQKTMPWINVEYNFNGDPLLTSTLKASGDWWGTLITDPAKTGWYHSPWISNGAQQSGTVLYWMREEVLP